MSITDVQSVEVLRSSAELTMVLAARLAVHVFLLNFAARDSKYYPLSNPLILSTDKTRFNHAKLACPVYPEIIR